MGVYRKEKSSQLQLKIKLSVVDGMVPWWGGRPRENSWRRGKEVRHTRVCEGVEKGIGGAEVGG